MLSPCPQLDPGATLVIPTRVWVDEHFRAMYPSQAEALADVEFVLASVQGKYDLLQKDGVGLGLGLRGCACEGAVVQVNIRFDWNISWAQGVPDEEIFGSPPAANTWVDFENAKIQIAKTTWFKTHLFNIYITG